MGPKQVRSSVLPPEEEAVVVAFRRYTLLPLGDCLYSLQSSIPHLTRPSVHRCLQRHGISRLQDVEGDKPPKKKFKSYPIGYFRIDIAEVQTDGCERRNESWFSKGAHWGISIDCTMVSIQKGIALVSEDSAAT